MLVAERAARAACAWVGWVAGSCLTPELSRRRPLVGHPRKNRFLSDESRSHSHGFGRRHCKVTHILWPREAARTCARTVRRASPYQAHSLMKKRTQRGHGGQGADRSAAGQASPWREVASAAAVVVKRQSFCFPHQALSPAAERSAPCPPCPRLVRFFMGVDAGISGTQTRMVVRHAPQLTNPALGIWKEELQDGSHQSRPRRLVVRCACDLHIVQIDA